MKTKLLVALAAMLALASCQNSPNLQPKSESVDFATAIGDYSTRAADNHWDAGDNVGIYMIAAGGTLDANALAQNKKYTTTGTNSLEAASAADEIYYPDNGAAVDFIAYYPWQTTITDFTYPVNVATQSPMTAIDLLYSDNATGYTKGDPTADMTFTHELSKIVFNIVDKTEAITMPSVTVEGINTTAGFSLVTGALSGAGTPADVAMVVSSTGDHSARAEAIILPAAEADYTFRFTIGEKTLRLVIEDLALEEGKKYTYTVNVTDKVLMDGEGEIIDWNEQPGEDQEFDVKDMIPLVYRLEKPAETFPLPPLTAAADLGPTIGLPDPFTLSVGGRITEFEQWEQRRSEIMMEIGHYEIGIKPGKPESVVATRAGNRMSVVVTHEGRSLTMSTTISTPTTGTGPFPVVIGMNSAPPAAQFSDCIRVTMSCADVARYQMGQTPNRTDPFWVLYPELAPVGVAGDYVAWSWGTSRIIDGLEQLVAAGTLNADLLRIGVYGCSYAGKMSLFSGAFDERVALTVVQESGGGGINSWRISDQVVKDNEEHGDPPADWEVERINNTSYTWFAEKLRTGFMNRSDCLPYDHHELIALIAPRAVVIHGNPDFVWMADKSGYTSTLAAYEVWKAMGIEDRFGWDFSSNHGHCSLPASQQANVAMFKDKFLFGREANTKSVRKAPDERYLYGLSVQTDHWIGSWKDYKLN
jgi:hypothetical protein